MIIKNKYKSYYADKLIEHMKGGGSFESFAGVIEVSIATIQEWLKSQEGFRDAYDIAYPQFLLFHENRVKNSDDSTALKLYMQNKLNWKISDKGGNAEVDVPVQLVFRKMEPKDGTEPSK